MQGTAMGSGYGLSYSSQFRGPLGVFRPESRIWAQMQADLGLVLGWNWSHPLQRAPQPAPPLLTSSAGAPGPIEGTQYRCRQSGSVAGSGAHLLDSPEGEGKGMPGWLSGFSASLQKEKDRWRGWVLVAAGEDQAGNEVCF